MLTCREVSNRATDYMESALPATKRVSVWAHLRICSNCRHYLNQLAATIGLARQAASEPPAPEAEDAVMGAFMRLRGGAPAE